MRKTYGVIVVAAAIALSPSRALAAPSACPSGGTPAPGSHVHGGLQVDGVCILNGVIVDGGVEVLGSGHLQLQSSTISGGVVVDPGGELDINATTLGTGIPTFTSSTVNGRTTVKNPAFDVDIWTAKLDGGIALDGTGSISIPVICGNDFTGDSFFSNFVNFGLIGGDTSPNGFPCGGNTFHGTVTLTNLTVFMGGNTIDGDLLCSNSSVNVTAPNTITGKNTCY
jgi:hypothetical protein